MFFTHTHVHKRQFPNGAEYLEMSLTGGQGLDGQGLIFVNDDYRMTEHPDHKRLVMRAKFGALDELQRKNYTDFVINMTACRYLDTASPEWLFEAVARRCVINGLCDPAVEASQFSTKRPRSKDKTLLASAVGMANAPTDRTRASIYVDDIGGSPSVDYQAVMTWLQEWRGIVTVAGYSTGGWEHLIDVEGTAEAIDKLPKRMLTSSAWTWKEDGEWAAARSDSAGSVTERTLKMLYQTDLRGERGRGQAAQ